MCKHQSHPMLYFVRVTDYHNLQDTRLSVFQAGVSWITIKEEAFGVLVLTGARSTLWSLWSAMKHPNAQYAPHLITVYLNTRFSVLRSNSLAASMIPTHVPHDVRCLAAVRDLEGSRCQPYTTLLTPYLHWL